MKIRAILIPFLILLSFSGYAQWNPAIHIPINDALGQSQQAPIDGRSEFYITSPPKWRPYQNTAEVLSTLTTTASRFGNFIIIVDSGGTLQSNGTFLNGHNTYYMFADSTTNGGLVKLNLFGTNGCSGCLLAANNLGDLISAPTARGNLGLGGMAVLGTTAGGDLSGTYPNPTVSKFNGQLPAFYLNYSNLTNPPPLVSLTTTGTSGLATYNSSTGVLNIPNYSGSGGSCLNCNADTIGEIPLNFVSFCNGCVLTLDSTAGYAYWSPPTGGVASLPPNGGAGFRIYSPQIPAIRSLVCASGCTIDSTTNSGSLTFTVTTSGAGTVTSFSAGNLTGFATTSVGTATTTPALTFSYVNAPAYNIWGNNTASPAAPFYFSPNLSILNQWSGGTIAMLGATQIFTGSNTFNGATTIGNNVTFSANNTYTIGNISDVAAHVWARVFESDAGVSLASTTGNSASIDIGANPGITLLSTGQGQLNNYTTPTSFTGTPISLLSVDASGNIIQTSLIYPVSAVQGLHASVTGDSVEMGGFFFQPDTVNTLGYGFAITNLPEEATLGVGDSVLVEKAGSKYLTLVPSSAIGGGGAVSSVSDNGGGTLTISPTTVAVLAGINLANANTWSVGQTFSAGITLGGSITLTGSSGSLNIGDISHVLLHTYTRNVNSDGGLDLNAATGAAVNVSINGVIKDATLSTGQKQWGGYGVGTFTGTPAYNISVDATGHAIETSLNPDVTTTIVSGSSSTVPNGTNSFIISLTTAGAYAITLPTTWNVNNDLWIRFVGNGTITDGNIMVTSLTIINGSGQTLDQAVAPAGGWLAGESIHYHLLPGSIDHLDN